MSAFAVYARYANGSVRLYTSFNASGGDDAGKPFSEAVARDLAANLNQFSGGDVIATVLPCEQITQPGV